MDINELSKDPWGVFIWRLREGEYPTNAEIAKALRDDATGKPFPPEVVEYIAGRLDGTVKRPRHRSKQTDDTKRWLPFLNLAFEVRILQAVYALDGQSRPRVRAIEAIANREGAFLSTHTVREKAKRLNKAPRKFQVLIPGVEEAVRILSAFRDEEAGGDNWLADYARECFGIELRGSQGVKKVAS